MKPLRPNTTKARILELITSSDGITNRELSAIVGKPTSTVSSCTTALRAAGLIVATEIGTTLSNLPILSFKANKEPVVSRKENVVSKQANAVSRKKPVVDSLDGLVTQLADSLAQRIAQQVMSGLNDLLMEQVRAPVIAAPTVETPGLDKLLEELAQLDDPAPTAKPQLPAPPKVRKPKVGVVGCIPAHAATIRADFEDVFDLTFWNDDGVPKLKSLGIANEVVFVTKFCSHRTTQTLASVGAKWVRVTGGFDDLHKAMTTYYVKTQDEALTS